MWCTILYTTKLFPTTILYPRLSGSLKVVNAKHAEHQEWGQSGLAVLVLCRVQRVYIIVHVFRSNRKRDSNYSGRCDLFEEVDCSPPQSLPYPSCIHPKEPPGALAAGHPLWIKESFAYRGIDAWERLFTIALIALEVECTCKHWGRSTEIYMLRNTLSTTTNFRTTARQHKETIYRVDIDTLQTVPRIAYCWRELRIISWTVHVVGNKENTTSDNFSAVCSERSDDFVCAISDFARHELSPSSH